MYNRRLLFASLATLLLLTVNIENTYAQQPVKIGISGGGTLSAHLKSFYFNEDDITLWLEPKFTTGYNTGLIVRKQLSPAYRLQVEPGLILLGARYEQPFQLRGFDFETESRTRLLYLQVPLVVQLSSTPNERTVFGRAFSETTYHITGGIFGGYLLSARFSGTNTGAPIGVEFEGDFTNDVRYQYNNLDGGLMLGAGIEHGSSDKVGLEVRAQYSLFNSSSNEIDQQFFPANNLGVTLSVYYIL